MANIVPTALFPNLTSDGTSITIPLSDLPALSASEADPVTGDGREVARALVEEIVSNILALDNASRPTQMIVAKANPSGQGIDTYRQRYTLDFDIITSPDGVTMDSE